MDGWQVAQNYIVAGVIFGGLGGYYYYTTKQRTPNRTLSSTIPASKRGDADARTRNNRRVTRERDVSELLSSDYSGWSQSEDTSSSRKRKVRKEAPQPSVASPKKERDGKAEKESDTNTAQFARQMMEARQGANLNSSRNKESLRVRTVKPRSVHDTPVISSASSHAGGEADDEATSPAFDAGDVSDMLEAKTQGPSSIRITAPLNAAHREKAPRQAKDEVVESKKQRQNRKRVEERKVQREDEERQRKVLEEKQRRSAREARGEPAKNGLAQSKAPINNPWEQKNTAAGVQLGASATPSVAQAPLLDTFDVESTGSSNGGLAASTAATSTTEGEHQHWSDNLSEEEQMAMAIKRSGDESGWTTVSAPKKKGKTASSGTATPSQ